MFGLPKTRAGLDENGHLAWAFERYLLEFHSELINTPYVLQLGLLGETRLLQLGRVWQNEPKADSKPGCRYFAETGHNICEPFLSYWCREWLGWCEPSNAMVPARALRRSRQSGRRSARFVGQ